MLQSEYQAKGLCLLDSQLEKLLTSMLMNQFPGGRNLNQKSIPAKQLSQVYVRRVSIPNVLPSYVNALVVTGEKKND
jgi:hypothetical protein